MVMIAKPLRRLRKALKKLILRRGRKGSVQTFETPTSIAEAEVEGGLENPNTAEEPQEQGPIPGGNDTPSVENLSSASEPSEQAGAVSASPSRDHLPPALNNHDVSNPNLTGVENSSSALSSTTNNTNSVPKETPNPWTPPVFDDVSVIETVKSALGESCFRRQLSFKFNHPLFDGKPYLGEPLIQKLTESSLVERLATMEDFDQRVSREKVLLEFCVHGHNDLLSGFIRVANMTYHKNVFVRFSYNGWSSHDDIKASHCFSYTEYNTDKFSFEIPLRQYFTTLEFVIGYETDGYGTYWDNNDGKYYTIVVEKAAAVDIPIRENLNKLLLDFDFSNQSTA